MRSPIILYSCLSLSARVLSLPPHLPGPPLSFLLSFSPCQRVQHDLNWHRAREREREQGKEWTLSVSLSLPLVLFMMLRARRPCLNWYKKNNILCVTLKSERHRGSKKKRGREKQKQTDGDEAGNDGARGRAETLDAEEERETPRTSLRH